MAWIRRYSVAALLVVALASRAESSVRHIVLLQSAERGNLILDRFTAQLRAQLGERSTDPLALTEFVVHPAGFNDSPEEASVEFLRAAFAGKPSPDLVVTTGGAAAAFFQKHRDTLFPDSPVLYASLDQRFISNRFTDRETAVAVALDPPATIDAILELLPDTTNIFVVVGGGALGRAWRAVLGQEATRYHDRLRFVWSDELSYAAMIAQASTLPAHSVIFFTSTYEVDGDGATNSTEHAIADLHTRANAPVFGMLTPEFGRGLVGGRLLDTDALSGITADTALKILGGTSPALLAPQVVKPGAPVFDARELERWDIREDRLPAGSQVLFREPGVWQRFKWIIAASAAALLAQSFLIAGLLVSGVKRRRAEQSLRESQAAISHFNQRLLEAQELERTRLARELHDDVCQQIAMLCLDLDRLSKLVPENQATARQQARDLVQEVGALGSHISAISHRLHSSKLDLLGLAAAAATFCKEIASHYGLIVEFNEENVPRTLPEGVAINVFRVLQESLSNAAKYSGAIRCVVSLDTHESQLRLRVSDEGRGFDVAGALASPGLGLISMQERLKLVGGNVSISSTIGAGTTILATVPLSTPAAAAAARPPQSAAIA